MNELVPVLDKLVNAGIVFGVIILLLVISVFSVVMTIVIHTFKQIRHEDTLKRKQRW